MALNRGTSFPRRITSNGGLRWGYKDVADLSQHGTSPWDHMSPRTSRRFSQSFSGPGSHFGFCLHLIPPSLSSFTQVLLSSKHPPQQIPSQWLLLKDPACDSCRSGPRKQPVWWGYWSGSLTAGMRVKLPLLMAGGDRHSLAPGRGPIVKIIIRSELEYFTYRKECTQWGDLPSIW